MLWFLFLPILPKGRHGRKSTASYLNFLAIAFGSLMELETQIQIAVRLDYIHEKRPIALLAQTDEIGKMLSGLKRSLSEKLE